MRLLQYSVGILLAAIVLVGCTNEGRDEVPREADSTSAATVGLDSSSVAIAVISLDPQGWNEVRTFMKDLPKPSSVSIYYGDGNVVTGDHARAMTLLDSLSSTQQLRPSDKPATLPYFSTALSSAIGHSLRSSCKHTRTVILGTFPPLQIKNRAEIERVGPIITKTELDALTDLPDHRFIMLGPSAPSTLRDMLLRAFEEAHSSVISISYQSGQ